MKETTVTSIGYSVTNGSLRLSLKGYPYTMFAKPSEIHCGGKNCEIADLVVGSKIKFETTGCEAVREIKNIIIISDGIREVDDAGNLVKW